MSSKTLTPTGSPPESTTNNSQASSTADLPTSSIASVSHSPVLVLTTDLADILVNDAYEQGQRDALAELQDAISTTRRSRKGKERAHSDDSLDSPIFQFRPTSPRFGARSDDINLGSVKDSDIDGRFSDFTTRSPPGYYHYSGDSGAQSESGPSTTRGYESKDHDCGRHCCSLSSYQNDYVLPAASSSYLEAENEKQIDNSDLVEHALQVLSTWGFDDQDGDDYQRIMLAGLQQLGIAEGDSTLERWLTYTQKNDAARIQRVREVANSQLEVIDRILRDRREQRGGGARWSNYSDGKGKGKGKARDQW